MGTMESSWWGSPAYLELRSDEMSLEDQLVYRDFVEALKLWKYQLKEEEDFFREVFMAVKSFVWLQVAVSLDRKALPR